MNTMENTELDFTHSVLRGRIVEHIFVGEILRRLWLRRITNVEVLRSEFDAHGYDIVMSRGDIVRHIQLKTQAGGKISVSRSLSEKPSGCVIWITLNRETLDMPSFRWFGGEPGNPLPDISSFRSPKRPTHNAQRERPERKNHVAVKPSDFSKPKSLDEIIVCLFGPLPEY
jgi:hypothetical protein